MAEESVMVLENSRPTLQALSQLAPQLNKATDLYVDELKEIEASLNKLNLGVTVELNEWFYTENTKTEWNDDGEIIGDFYTAWTIGYGKDNRDAWCLLVREYKVSAATDDSVEQHSAPLLQVSRDLRIAAAKHIPDLLKEIEAEVKEKIETLAKVSDKR
jgi:hypothetical protein